MNKAVILARVSTAKQEKEGLSLKDIQLPELRDYAKNKEYPIDTEFVFSESADNKIRKKFDEMIQYVKQNKDIKIIIAYRVDRMTRNYRDAVLIDELRLEYDKEIHFVHDRLVITKNTVGRDIQDWDTKVFLAKQYLNCLKEDAVFSAQSKLRNNEWPAPAPYGYRNTVREGTKKKWVEPDEIKSKAVQMMYEWYATGAYSMLEIIHKVKETFGIHLSKGNIDRILKNQFYYGIMLYNNYPPTPHFYEQLISKEKFDAVQHVKASYKKKHFKFAGLPFLYRGLIRCFEQTCSCMITPEKKKGKYVFYHCTQYKGKHSAAWLREEELTHQFKRAYTSLQIPQEIADDIVTTLKESHEAKSKFHKSMLENYANEYQKYEDRIEKMYEDKLDGSITESFYNQKREEYRAKQAEIKAKIDRLGQADEEYYMTADYLLKLANHAADLFESSEPEEKRLLLKLTLQNLRLDEKKLVFDWVKPFDTLAFYASRSQWLPGRDSNPDTMLQRHVSYH